ncbi:MAG: protein-disulfide reductase DsbD N-terminal domain-containing protein [Porticoccaceae bacterium]|nr:protein-disulfide reductase DsbD N-terminal domain-containing protein [Porticoccaceae bacterium]
MRFTLICLTLIGGWLASSMATTETYSLDQFDEAVAALVVAEPTSRAPLQINATLVPMSASPGDTVVAVVKVRLMAGWHIYAQVPASEPFIQTQWLLELEDGLAAVDEWSGPAAQAYAANPEIEIHKGSESELVFFRELVVTENAADNVAVSAGLRFQACDPNICLPPKKSVVDLMLTVKAP